MTGVNEFLNDLTPTQEHFLKKFVIQNRLEKELKLLSRPDCLQLFGEPFKTSHSNAPPEDVHFPLIRFFFDNYISTFPFISNNSIGNQTKFWSETVQPFVEKSNSKQLSNSNDRKEKVTKRRQINLKFLSGLSLFYNSMITTEKDMIYLTSDHLTSSDMGKLDKLKGNKLQDFSLDGKTEYINGIDINIVAVDQVNKQHASGWFYHGTTHHYEFVIQISLEAEKSRHYVARSYHDFKSLESGLIRHFPGIMHIETSKLPEKFKHDDKSLVKEKLRLSLRGYLKQLLKFPELIESSDFQSFIYKDNFKELSVNQKNDYEQRKAHEKHIIATQVEFQLQVSKIMIDFTKKFDEFKAQLIQKPDTLVKIFEEIGQNESMENLSPLLLVFIEWCKIEISATLFQVFLTQDNSNELLNLLKRFHRTFPYTVMYNLLKFTNPMSMVSKIISFLLMTIPGTKKSLLSMIFIMLLDDDLSGYDTEINELKLKLSDYPHTVRAIEAYVDDKLIEESFDVDENLREILDHHVKEVTALEKGFMESGYKDKVVYNNLKQLYQLKIRQNDKLILKSLWEEPELTKLLKQFLIIFYQPLIKLLSKSQIHVFFKDFQHFIDELVELLVKLNEEEIYYLSSIEIFDKLMNLLNKHIIIFWKFIHSLYNNDRDQLFIKLISWIQNFLEKLRLKYVNPEKVLIDLKLIEEPLDKELFFKQLNERVDNVVSKRKLFKEYYDAKLKEKDGSLDQNWDEIHQSLMDYDDKFGLDLEELQEVNFESNIMDSAFQKKIQQFNTFEHDSTELDKFDGHLIDELNRLFMKFK